MVVNAKSVIVPISMSPEIIIRQSPLFPLGEFVDMTWGDKPWESSPQHTVNGLGISNLGCPVHIYRFYHLSKLEIFCETVTENPIISTSVIQDTSKRSALH